MTHEYNAAWRLGMNAADVDAAVTWSLEGERVAIETLLKRLVALEPPPGK